MGKHNLQEGEATSEQEVKNVSSENTTGKTSSTFNIDIFSDEDITASEIAYTNQPVSSATSSDDTIETQMIDLMTSIKEKRRPIVVESSQGFLQKKDKSFTGRYPIKVVPPNSDFIPSEKEPRIKFSNSLWFSAPQKPNKETPNKGNTHRSFLKSETLRNIKQMFGSNTRSERQNRQPSPTRNKREAPLPKDRSPTRSLNKMKKRSDVFDKITLNDLQPFESEYSKCLEGTDDRGAKPKRVLKGRSSRSPSPRKQNSVQVVDSPKKNVNQSEIYQDAEERSQALSGEIELDQVSGENLDVIPEVPELSESAISQKVVSEKTSQQDVNDTTTYPMDISNEDTKNITSTQTEIQKPGMNKGFRTLAPRWTKGDKSKKSISKNIPNPRPWKPTSKNPKNDLKSNSSSKSSYGKHGAIPKNPKTIKPSTSYSIRGQRVGNLPKSHNMNKARGSQAVDYKIKNILARFNTNPFDTDDYGSPNVNLVEFIENLKKRNSQLQNNIQHSIEAVAKKSSRDAYDPDYTDSSSNEDDKNEMLYPKDVEEFEVEDNYMDCLSNLPSKPTFIIENATFSNELPLQESNQTHLRGEEETKDKQGFTDDSEISMLETNIPIENETFLNCLPVEEINQAHLFDRKEEEIEKRNTQGERNCSEIPTMETNITMENESFSDVSSLEEICYQIHQLDGTEEEDEEKNTQEGRKCLDIPKMETNTAMENESFSDVLPSEEICDQITEGEKEEKNTQEERKCIDIPTMENESFSNVLPSEVNNQNHKLSEKEEMEVETPKARKGVEISSSKFTMPMERNTKRLPSIGISRPRHLNSIVEEDEDNDVNERRETEVSQAALPEVPGASPSIVNMTIDYADEEPRPVRSVRNVMDLLSVQTADEIPERNSEVRICTYITRMVEDIHSNNQHTEARNQQMVPFHGILPNLYQLMNCLLALLRCDFTFRRRVQLDLFDTELEIMNESFSSMHAGENSQTGQRTRESSTELLDLYKCPNMGVQTDGYDSEDSASETDYLHLGPSQTIVVSIRGNRRNTGRCNRKRRKDNNSQNNENVWSRDDWHALLLNGFYITYFILVYFCMTLSNYTCSQE